MTKLSRWVQAPSADLAPNAAVIASLISPLRTVLSSSSCVAIERAASIRRDAVSGAWSVSLSMGGSFLSDRYGPESLDRKSVVSGKSVSVRVDLGGLRIIKKKKKKPTNTDPKFIQTQIKN